MILRIGLPLLGAMLVSLALFWFMQFMITGGQHGLRATHDERIVEFVRLKREIVPEERRRELPKRTPPLEPPPPPPEIQQTAAEKPRVPKLAMDIPRLDLPMDLDHRGMLDGVVVGAAIEPGAQSNEIIPLLRIAPQYPLRAARRGIEGWVKVEFTVTETGTVADARVLESDPESIFDRAAIRAIYKWRFKPKTVAGQAVARRAVQVLEFELDS